MTRTLDKARTLNIKTKRQREYIHAFPLAGYMFQVWTALCQMQDCSQLESAHDKVLTQEHEEYSAIHVCQLLCLCQVPVFSC